MIKHHKSEQGQAIVFLVLGLVVFMGFVALAIDGGMAFSDRRHSQNGSDAASLAGGGEAALYLENSHVMYQNWNENCASDPDIWAAMQLAEAKAIERAGTNGFTVDGDPTDDGNRVTVSCGVHDYGYLDKFLDVTVEVSSTTETSFAQLLFPSALVNQVDSVTRVRPRMSLAFGHAVVGLNTADCPGNNGVSFGGSGDTIIDGGGIWSNGCLSGNGDNFDADIINGNVNYAGGFHGNNNFDPDPSQVPYTLPPSSFEIPMPNCNDGDAHRVNSLPDTLSAGLWCVNAGHNVNLNNGSIEGYGVTIVLVDGSLSINGGVTVNLAAPVTDPDPSPAVAGLLFYVPNGDITINGGSEQHYEGLIYAPNNDCTINGNSAFGTLEMNTQIVCFNVAITGNTTININFNAGQEYQKPTSIELFR
jgi:hypothetical protein